MSDGAGAVVLGRDDGEGSRIVDAYFGQIGLVCSPGILRDIRDEPIAMAQTLLPEVLKEFSNAFPAQRPPKRRLVACIVGVGSVGSLRPARSIRSLRHRSLLLFGSFMWLM